MPSSYPVITSQAASKNFAKIKSEHDTLVQELSNQSSKRTAYYQQQAADMAAQNSMNMEIAKDKEAAQSDAQRNAMDFNQKQAQIDIQRASLAMKS